MRLPFAQRRPATTGPLNTIRVTSPAATADATNRGFMSWFGVRETGRSALESGELVTLEPGGFQVHIRLAAAVDGRGTVRASALRLDRTWLGGPGGIDPNAVDIAKSFLLAAAPEHPSVVVLADAIMALPWRCGTTGQPFIARSEQLEAAETAWRLAQENPGPRAALTVVLDGGTDDVADLAVSAGRRTTIDIALENVAAAGSRWLRLLVRDADPRADGFAAAVAALSAGAAIWPPERPD
jgi:hypothetical protein